MVNFHNNTDPGPDKGKGRSNGSRFLREAKERYERVLVDFMVKEERYRTIVEYTEALINKSWPVVDALIRQSYKNGRRGGGRS